MNNQSYYQTISNDKRQLGPYPMDRLRQVENPTTKITDNIQRIDEREHGFNRALRGDFGPLAAKERNRFTIKHPLGASTVNMTAYLAQVVDGIIAKARAPITEDPVVLSRHIKRLGYFLRADIVGICRLPQYAIYSYDKDGNQVELNHKYAIVIVVDQDFQTMNGSSGYDWISISQSFMSYSTTAFISCIMADYIRRLGYPARAHHARNYQVVVPPLLLLSGIGEMSRTGVVLNPFIGLRLKAAVVTTNLPLIPDRPVDFGLQDFCRKCMKCADECPSKAIPKGDTVMHNGYEVWKFDVERCTKFRLTNQNGASCGRCIKVCPWNKPQGWIHDLVRWMIGNTPRLNKLIIKMDDVFGYGQQNTRDKWWFDLEEVDGTLQIPEGKNREYKERRE